MKRTAAMGYEKIYDSSTNELQGLQIQLWFGIHIYCFKDLFYFNYEYDVLSVCGYVHVH